MRRKRRSKGDSQAKNNLPAQARPALLAASQWLAPSRRPVRSRPPPPLWPACPCPSLMGKLRNEAAIGEATNWSAQLRLTVGEQNSGLLDRLTCYGKCCCCCSPSSSRWWECSVPSRREGAYDCGVRSWVPALCHVGPRPSPCSLDVGRFSVGVSEFARRWARRGELEMDEAWKLYKLNKVNYCQHDLNSIPFIHMYWWYTF